MYTSSGMNGFTDDLMSVVDRAKQIGTELVTKDIPQSLTNTLQNKALSVAQPIVQQAIANRSAEVVSKGNVALTAGIGLAAGALAGGKQRWWLGGLIGGTLGALVGFKIGWLKSELTGGF